MPQNNCSTDIARKIPENDKKQCCLATFFKL